MTIARPPRPSVVSRTGWTFPLPRVHQLDNGMAVWIYDLRGQYVVTAGLVLDVPVSVEPRAIEGVSTLCLRTLDEGTVSHPGPLYGERLENRGAYYSGAASLSAAECYLDVPVTEFTAALPLFAEGVLHAAHEDVDVDRLASIRLNELGQTQANSASLASALTRATLFSPDSRASRLTGGQTDTVRAITGADVRDFHRRWFSPTGSTLVLAGDFTGRDVLGAVRDAFGGWDTPSGRAVHTAEGVNAPRSRLIHREGAVQADIRLAAPGLDRHDPRWPALQVGCSIVGGAFLSRLNRVIREERGYTYGISMAPHPLRIGGYLTVASSMRTSVIAPALAEIDRLIEVGDRPFTTGEVTDAVNHLLGVAPLRYSTADAVATQAAALAAAGLEPDHLQRTYAAVARLTPAQVTQTYGELVSADRLSRVIVGDADVLSHDLGLEAEQPPTL